LIFHNLDVLFNKQPRASALILWRKDILNRCLRFDCFSKKARLSKIRAASIGIYYEICIFIFLLTIKRIGSLTPLLIKCSQWAMLDAMPWH
jgi:hypothetical protein